VPVVAGGAELVGAGAGTAGAEVDGAGAGAAEEAVDAESEDFPFMLVMKNTAATRARPPRMAT
jgi:hypothetical protein